MNVTNKNSTSPQFLDPYHDRPKLMEELVDVCLHNLKEQTTSNWGLFNGSVSYDMMKISEKHLFKHIILNAPPEQKDFYFVEIGAGNFELENAMAEYIDQQDDLPKGIKVHIIGVRGERNIDQEVSETKRCKIYKFGAFKVENIMEEFKKRELDLENKVDFAISKWAFRHFVDPTGTYVQTIDLLAKKGFLIMDGFFIGHMSDKSCNEPNEYGNARMIQLLFQTKVPFLMERFFEARSMNRFVLQKQEEGRCQIPMSYSNKLLSAEHMQVGSNRIYCYEIPESTVVTEYNSPNQFDTYYGSKELYYTLRKNGILTPDGINDFGWLPMRPEDGQMEDNELHKAVRKGNSKDVEKLLPMTQIKDSVNSKSSIDIEDITTNGDTALHIAVRNNNEEIIKFLLENGANPLKRNFEKKNSLHLAAEFDQKGAIVKMLLMKINNPNKEFLNDLLKEAIKHKNVNAVKLFIEQGVELSYDQRTSLRDDPVFSHLFEKDKKRGNVLNDIFNWLDNGDMIVLHSDCYNGIMCHSGEKKRNLVYIDVDERLLNEGEWPDFLKCAGYNFVPYDSVVEKQFGANVTFSYIVPRLW